MLIFASIHGSDPTIIRNIIRYLNKKADFDGFAIGSLLPIYSNYQLLIDIILSARKELLTKPLHVYGLAGPVISELLAFLGVDMMDSSSFVISAAKKYYFVPNFKRMQIHDVSLYLRSKSKSQSSSLLLNNCSCKVCINHSINDLIKSRELLSFHNLLVSWNQIKQFRLALTEKRLDQYLQVRFSKTPWARKAFEYAKHRIRYGGVS